MGLNTMKQRAGQTLLTLSAVSLLSLTACGPNFEAVQNLTSGGGSNNTAGTTDAQTQFQNLKVDGTVSGGSYGDNQVISIDKQTRELIIRFPDLATPIMPSKLDVPIPDIQGAHLTMEATPDGNLTLALRIPLDKVMKGIAFLPPSKLPNGDPIPGVPDGELPMAAVQLTQTSTKVSIYLSPSFVGIYSNAPFDPYIALTLPIRNEARTKTWGYFSTIPAKPGGTPGGFFVSVKLPDDVARIIDDVL